MNRLDELHALLSENLAKATELLKREDEAEKCKCRKKLEECKDRNAEEGRCRNKTLWVFAVIGLIAAAAAAIYGLYRFFAPDYLEDFEDDFDDDFDDDFFEDEAEETAKEEAKEEETNDEEASDDTITEEMTEEE